MNTAEYVDQQIQVIKGSGIPLSEAAWQAALLCVGWPYIYGERGKNYCTPAVRRAVWAKHSAEQPKLKEQCKNVEGTGSCSGCKWYPQNKRVRCFDCRGFTYWILLQIYGWELMGGGCTSQWNNEDNWKAKGNVSDGIPQDTIVCLFYWKKDKSGRRTSTVAHTGLYFNGETCECSAGVQYKKQLDPKWEMWGIPACVDSVVPPAPSPTPEPVPDGYAIVTGKNVALREGPSTSCKVIVRVPTGTTVKISEPPEDWEYIEHGGNKGYMMKKFLKER